MVNRSEEIQKIIHNNNERYKHDCIYDKMSKLERKRYKSDIFKC